MSELVKRLREEADFFDMALFDQSADRIEKLEAALREIGGCQHILAAHDIARTTLFP